MFIVLCIPTNDGKKVIGITKLPRLGGFNILVNILAFVPRLGMYIKVVHISSFIFLMVMVL